MTQKPPRLGLYRLWYALGAALLLAVAALSLMPIPDIGVSDKASHLFTYFLLSGWFSLLARDRFILAGSVAALAAYGLLLEGLQGLTAYRVFEWADALANGSGCLLGACFYFTPLRRWFGYFDARLAALFRG